MGIDEIKKLFMDCKKDVGKWAFANGILYRMCKENPLHTNPDVIAGKLLLIGRSYAAAIERRKNGDESNDDFYYNSVSPRILDISTDIDFRLNQLNHSTKTLYEDVKEVLSIHKCLTDTFHELTNEYKRSLASKYLHFHCPERFFIYDLQAQEAIKSLKIEKKKLIDDSVSYYDSEYKSFVEQMLSLQQIVEEIEEVSPRGLDKFLLWVHSKNEKNEAI